MRTARLEFEKNTSAGSNATKIEILLTDGYSTSTHLQDEQEAQLAAAENITIFAIGIADYNYQVDETFLRHLTDLTGGTNGNHYFFVRNNAELLRAYEAIGVIINQHITKISTINVVPDGTKIGSLWFPNMTYVSNSAYVNNGSVVQQKEPVIANVNDNYTLSWPIDPMSIGGRWVLNYTLILNRTGPARPAGFTSNVNVNPYDSSELPFTQYFYSDIINVGTNGTMINTRIMNIDFTLPTMGSNISQPYQVVAWNVMYNSTGTYRQLVEFAPAGTNDFRPIASGFSGSQSAPFDTVWDIAKMGIGPGVYTIRITATDGMFTVSATRDIRISYTSGKINLGQPDTKVPY